MILQRNPLFISMAIASIVCSNLAIARELRIEHVTVVSPERSQPLRDRTVAIRDETIVSVQASGSKRSAGSNVEIIDATGLFLSPGLIDSHVHTNEAAGMLKPMEEQFPAVARALREQLPRSYLYFGFTTLIDVMSTPEHVRAWDEYPAHPDLYFCGATPIPGGYPSNYRTREEQAQLFPYLLEEGGDVAALVKRMKADGALCVKTFYERGFGEDDVWPVPRLDTIRALIKAAHAAHMPVLMHANSTDGQAFALQAGADIIAHGLWHWNREPQATTLTPRAKEILQRVLKADVGWQATLRVLAGHRDVFDPQFLSDPRVAAVVPNVALDWYRTDAGQWFHRSTAPIYLSKAALDSGDPARQWDFIRSAEAPLIGPAIERGASSARYMTASKARFLFGSDTPGSPSFANQPGLNGWLEMRLLVEAGLTPAEVFHAATLSNAKALGLASKLGTVQLGKRANLLLTRQDPSQSVQAYDEIVKVIVGGRVLDRSELMAR